MLTFDDGPDPRYTPRILDTLKSRQAPAAFFVTGLSANAYPGLLRREYREGHEIGNHSYTHPHFDRISRAQLLLELNLTARLFESLIGARTILFRPPYGIDHQPEAPEEVALLPVPQSLGYVIVGSKIDPHDWGEPGGGPPPPPAELARRVLSAARRGVGNIVLMHDGGGDRTGTADALPMIVDGLRAEGFKIVSVSELLGQARAATMPPLTPDERWTARVDRLVFDLYAWTRVGVAWIFVAGIVLVSARALGVGLLAVVEKLLRRPPPAFDGAPARQRARPGARRGGGHRRHRALGARQRLPVARADRGRRRLDGRARPSARSRPRPATRGSSLIRQPNRGKAAALNHALAEAKGEIVVTIDADTAVDPRAISLLVRHFADPTVGAVAGNVKVANRDRWITRWQALEYVTSQNLEKRAFDLLNCITVVPGALGVLADRGPARDRRPHAGHRGRGRGPDDRGAPPGLAHHLRRPRDRLDAGPGGRARARLAALPLDLRHAAGGVQAPRHAVPPALRLARARGAAEHPAVPDPAAGLLAADRPAVPRLAAAVRPLEAALHAAARAVDRATTCCARPCSWSRSW